MGNSRFGAAVDRNSTVGKGNPSHQGSPWSTGLNKFDGICSCAESKCALIYQGISSECVSAFIVSPSLENLRESMLVRPVDQKCMKIPLFGWLNQPTVRE